MILTNVRAFIIQEVDLMRRTAGSAEVEYSQSIYFVRFHVNFILDKYNALVTKMLQVHYLHTLKSEEVIMFKKVSAAFLCLLCCSLSACVNPNSFQPQNDVTSSQYQTTNQLNAETSEEKTAQNSKDNERSDSMCDSVTSTQAISQPKVETSQDESGESLTAQKNKESQDFEKVQSLIDDLERTLNDLDEIDENDVKIFKP